MNNHDNSLISDDSVQNEQFARDAGLETFEDKQERMYPSGAEQIELADWSNLDGFDKKVMNSGICSNLSFRLNKHMEKLEKLVMDDSPDPKGYKTKQTSELTSNLMVIKGMYADACEQFIAIYGERWDDYKGMTTDSGIVGKSEQQQVKEAALAALKLLKA